MRNFLLFLSFLGICCILSCKKNNPAPVQLTSITLTKDTLSLNVGSTQGLVFTFSPSNYDQTKLVWHSSDNSILSVNNLGVVTANKEGEAVVTVSNSTSTVKATCLVYVLPASGLIAYYPFDNSGRDFSNNGNNGIVHNATAVPDRNNKANSAYHFDGTTSVVSVADNQSLRLGNTDFTLSTWLKLDSYNSSYVSSIISKRIAGFNGGWLWAVNGQQNPPPLGAVYFGPGGGNSDAVGSKVLAPGQWYMVTCVYTKANDQLSIYVNGVFDKTVGGILPPDASITATLLIGADGYAGANGYFFQGSLDDVRIYSTALTANAVQQLYNTIF